MTMKICKSHDLTKREAEILKILQDGEWHQEDTLKTRWNFLRDMSLQGYVDGAMYTIGNTPEDRVWRIASKGREALLATAKS